MNKEVKRFTLIYKHPQGHIETVELYNGEIWKLNGECNRCGACCQKTIMPIKEFQDKHKGCKFFSYEVENGKKVGKCEAIWHRLQFCLLYPIQPYDKLDDDCSFTWERMK